MSDEEKVSVLARLVGVAGGLAAVWVAQRAVSGAWRAASGHPLPKAEDPGDARLREVLVAAALSGAVVALARALVTRGTASFARRVDADRAASHRAAIR